VAKEIVERDVMSLTKQNPLKKKKKKKGKNPSIERVDYNWISKT